MLHRGSVLLWMCLTSSVLEALGGNPISTQPGHYCMTFQRGACPTGWRGWRDSCYKPMEMITNRWEIAMMTCTDIGGWLVVPNSVEENAYIWALGDMDWVWINCTDIKEEGSWECLEQNKNVNFRNWGINSLFSEGKCAAIGRDGIWHDIPCNYALVQSHVVCKRSAPVFWQNWLGKWCMKLSYNKKLKRTAKRLVAALENYSRYIMTQFPYIWSCRDIDLHIEPWTLHVYYFHSVLVYHWPKIYKYDTDFWWYQKQLFLEQTDSTAVSIYYGSSIYCNFIAV